MLTYLIRLIKFEREIVNIESTVKDIGREIETKVTFPAAGTFVAIGNAKSFLKKKGYILGSMQRGNPIGFIKGSDCEYISKWDNMTGAEHKQLDGVILSDRFRESDVTVIFFKTE